MIAVFFINTARHLQKILFRYQRGIWATHTLYAGRFNSDHHLLRVFALIIMGSLIMHSSLIRESHADKFVHFALLYAKTRAKLASPYSLIHSKHQDMFTFAKGFGYAI